MLAMVLIAVSFFYLQLQGLVLRQFYDEGITASSQEIEDSRDSGSEILWTNAIFGGVPSHVLQDESPGNIIQDITDILGVRPGPLGAFFLTMLACYILCISFGFTALLSGIGATAFGLATNHMGMLAFGQESDLLAIAFLCLAFAGVVRLRKGQWLLGGSLLALGISVSVSYDFNQTTYIWLVPILGYLVFNPSFKEVPAPVKGARIVAIVAGALILGFLSNSALLWNQHHYSSAANEASAVMDDAQTASTSIHGNSIAELFTYVLPGIRGGASREVLNSDDSYVRTTGNLVAPLYWGNQNGPYSPPYVSIVLFALCIIGFFYNSRNVILWFSMSAALIMILSLGGIFGGLSHLTQALPHTHLQMNVTGISSALNMLLIIYSLSSLHSWMGRKKSIDFRRSFLLAAGAIGIILLGVLIGGFLTVFSDGTSGSSALEELRKSTYFSNILKVFLLSLVALAILYLNIKKRLADTWMIIALGILVVADLFSEGKNIIHQVHYLTPNQTSAIFAPRQVDDLIVKDEDPHYRVLDLAETPQFQAFPAAHYKILGGPDIPKIRRYQDVYNRYIAAGHDPVLNMLNTKYVIQRNAELQVNIQALGNAWFVLRLLEAKDDLTEFNALEKFDPSTVALFHQQYSDYVEGIELTQDGTIELSEYTPDKLTYTTTGTGTRFAVFSEIFYDQDDGWKAFLDNEEVEFIRVNYLLRGMKIPPGAHEIRFEYSPSSYYTGKTVSYIFSGILLLFLAVGIFTSFRPLGRLSRK